MMINDLRCTIYNVRFEDMELINGKLMYIKYKSEII
jgi:hypothetical protein